MSKQPIAYVAKDPNKTDNPLTQEEQKKLIAEYTIDTLLKDGRLFSGMKLGLGTGSTVMPAIEHLAKKIYAGQLKDVKVVATSFQTQIACENFGLPVYSLNARDINAELDLTIDGADEFDPDNYLVKGGGAALFLEKLVAYSSKHLVIVADETKRVDKLAVAFPLPVEIIPESRIVVARALEALGAEVQLREGVRKAGPVVTDNGNFILDARWEENRVFSVPEYEAKINAITGVVDNGFFAKTRPVVFVANADGSVNEILPRCLTNTGDSTCITK